MFEIAGGFAFLSWLFKLVVARIGLVVLFFLFDFYYSLFVFTFVCSLIMFWSICLFVYLFVNHPFEVPLKLALFVVAEDSDITSSYEQKYKHSNALTIQTRNNRSCVIDF